MALPERATHLSRSEWYRQAIANDPAKQREFDRAVKRADAIGIPDDLDAIEAALTESAP